MKRPTARPEAAYSQEFDDKVKAKEFNLKAGIGKADMVRTSHHQPSPAIASHHQPPTRAARSVPMTAALALLTWWVGSSPADPTPVLLRRTTPVATTTSSWVRARANPNPSPSPNPHLTLTPAPALTPT